MRSLRRRFVPWLAIAPLALAATAAAQPAPDDGSAAAPPPVARADEGAVYDTRAPVGPVAVAPRNEIERAWFAGGEVLGSRASLARLRAVELGARGAPAAARALIAPGAGPTGLGRALLAVRLAPDLPLAWLALARVHWQDGERAAAARDVVAGLSAIARNIEATFWLGSSAALLFVAVMVGASLCFVTMVGLSFAPRAAHDLGDLLSKRLPGFARGALLAALVLTPLLLGEGMLGVIAALFAIGMVYGSSRHRMSLALAAALLVLGLFPLARIAGTALGALGADPVAAAALSVEQGIETRPELALLGDAAAQDADELAALALAIHARRSGDDEAALARYEALREQLPTDPVVLNNLANLIFHRGGVEPAIALYEGAAEHLDSPVVWFNLSQAYARSFRMEAFEEALRRAQQRGPEVVAELSQHEDPLLTADLPIPLGRLRARMWAAADGDGFARALRAPLAPGRLGTAWGPAAGVFAAFALLMPVLASRFELAGSCRRCGVRICARCDGTVWNRVTCESCHRLFSAPETTDPGLRQARLAALRQREERLGRIAGIAGVLLPGVGGLVARRPDLALFALLLFGWALAAGIWHPGVVPDPLVLGAAGPALLLASAALAMAAYAGVVFTALALRRSS